MSVLTRLNDFTPGTVIASQQVDDEFNQIINFANNDSMFRMKSFLTPVSNSGTGETDLFSFIVPTNSLNNTEEFIMFRVVGITANNANAKTIRVYWNGTSFGAPTTATGALVIWEVECWIIRNGTNVNTLLLWRSNNAGGSGTFARDASGVIATVFGGTVILKITGQGGATTDITAERALVLK